MYAPWITIRSLSILAAIVLLTSAVIDLQRSEAAPRSDCPKATVALQEKMNVLADLTDTSAPRNSLVAAVTEMQHALEQAKRCGSTANIALPKPKQSSNPTTSGKRPSPGELTERLGRTHRPFPTEEAPPADDDSQGGLLGMERLVGKLKDEVGKDPPDHQAIKSLLESFRAKN